jgi:ribosomal protein S20
MKKSELKNEIKNYIYEILSEVTVVDKNTKPDEVKDEDPLTVKSAIETAKKTNKPVTIAEKEDEEEEKEDNWNKPDKDDKGFDDEKEPSKKELEKEKVKGAPSKFKTSQADFEDFKTKLKTLVKKIKAMDKGDEKDKKMAALKQFIKKPELVKAFKERDVKIDTDGLVG